MQEIQIYIDEDVFYTGICVSVSGNGRFLSCSSGFKEIPIYATSYYGSKDCGKTGNYFSYKNYTPVDHKYVSDGITFKICPDNE